MAEVQNLCPVCAWRETCRRRFLLSGSVMRCPEFVRDVTIKDKDAVEDSKVTGVTTRQ